MTINTNYALGSLAAVDAMLRPLARGLQMDRDQATGAPVVRIVDTETNRVLRHIPPADALAMARALDRVQGLLVQVKA